LIFAREHCNSEQRDIIRDAISNKSSENFDQILKIVSETGGVDYSLNRAREHSSHALKALQGLPEGQYKKVLTELATFAVSRDI
jgi:octaprenyl-diphosphate synthase